MNGDELVVVSADDSFKVSDEAFRVSEETIDTVAAFQLKYVSEEGI